MRTSLEWIAGGLAWLLVAIGAVGSAAAQDAAALRFGDDAYGAGADVRIAEAVIGDAFLAGATVDVDASVGGSAHLAGRQIRLAAPVAGGLYAAGYSIEIGAAVEGQASLFGAEIDIGSAIGGNLRAFGAEVRIDADIGGAALLGGDDVALNGAIAGDARITADDVSFGPGAGVAGRLTLIVPDPDAVTVPSSVAAADRVEIRRLVMDDGDVPEGIARAVRRSAWSVLGGFVWGAVSVAIVSALAVALAPVWVARVRQAALERPGRAILGGFGLLSFLVGSGFVLALTLIGLLLVPAMLVLSALAGVAGYAAGSYILGVGLWQAAGRAMPEAWFGKAGLALLGAVLASLLALVPVIGWLAVLGLVFLGLGGMVLTVLGPRAAT